MPNFLFAMRSCCTVEGTDGTGIHAFADPSSCCLKVQPVDRTCLEKAMFVDQKKDKVLADVSQNFWSQATPRGWNCHFILQRSNGQLN